MNVGSLFTGIGGFDLGLERAGMRVVWQCEQDEFCRRVLARHWPGVPCHPDVRTLVADAATEQRRGGQVIAQPHMVNDGPQPQHGPAGLGTGEGVPVPVPYVDVLCGGFPCQDISVAGAGAGIRGSRSGLWGHFARLISDLRPRYVIVENVPALTARGLDTVLADLAQSGFDAEWDCLPASAFGAPHRRDRLWLVAYPQRDAVRDQPGRRNGTGRPGPRVPADDGAQRLVADPELSGLEGFGPVAGQPQEPQPGDGGWWATEPDVGRVAHGIPHRVDRLRALGNALVPQIAERIGRQIMTRET